MELVVCIVAYICIAISGLISLKNGRWVTFGFSILAMSSLIIITFIGDSNRRVKKELTKEVNLDQVMVKGKNNFFAKIEIEYKDGELETITLLPETTVPKPKD